jgi:hypothetical protein
MVSTKAAPTLWSNHYTTIYSINSSGTTAENPILISTPGELAGLAARIDSNLSSDAAYRSYYYRLTASIDLLGHNWVPIGSKNAFSGEFDGNGFIIKNMKIEPNSNNVGLFANTSGATIKNLKVEGLITTSSSIENIGGIVGKATGTTFYRVSSAVTIDAKNASYIGGIVGATTYINIKNVSNSGKVEGASGIGGIIGGVNEVGGIYGIGSSLTKCFNTGFINASGNYVGGLVGKGNVGKQLEITDSYNQGTVSGKENRGGLVGYLEENKVDYYIRNCYNSGTISSNGYTKYVGSLVGRNVNDKGDVINCYYLANSSNPNKGLGTKNGGGTDYSKVYRKSQSELKAASIVSTISSSMSAKANSYPILTSAKSGMATVLLPNTIWEVRTNINDGYPIFIEFYW